MGAWDIGFFDDDSSLDILDEFSELEPLEFMKAAFTDALQLKYLEYEAGINVLVSAALIDVSLNNTNYEILNEEYPNVIEVVKKLNVASLKDNAVKALKVVMSESSELNELWSEAKEYQDWLDNIKDLISRLK